MVFTFNSLANHMAISTEEWQKLRDQFDNRYWMDSAALHTKHNMLDVKFLIAPTYRTGQPVSGKTKGPKPVANRYSVLIRYLTSSAYFQAHSKSFLISASVS